MSNSMDHPGYSTLPSTAEPLALSSRKTAMDDPSVTASNQEERTDRLGPPGQEACNSPTAPSQAASMDFLRLLDSPTNQGRLSHLSFIHPPLPARWVDFISVPPSPRQIEGTASEIGFDSPFSSTEGWWSRWDSNPRSSCLQSRRLGPLEPRPPCLLLGKW